MQCSMKNLALLMELRVVLYVASGNDVHALLREPALQHADTIMGHVNEERSISKEEHFDNVDRAEFPMGYV